MSVDHVTALENATSGSVVRPGRPYIYPAADPSAFAGNMAPNSWQRWTQMMSNNGAYAVGPSGDFNQPQEFMTTANTLISLGSRESSGQETGVEANGSVEAHGLHTSGSTSLQWPQNVLGMTPGGHGNLH